MNISLVKKFLERKKREQQIKLKHIKNIIFIKNTKNEKKTKKVIDNIKEKKDDLNLPPPIYLKLITENKLSDVEIQYLDNYDNSNSIISNQTKKNKRNFKNNFATNNKISFKNKIFKNNNRTKNEKNIIFNKKDYPYNMNESQMYEFFLKIHTNSDFELNELSYNNAIKIDKRTYFQYYLSLIRAKHLLFFSFWPTFDYNSQIIKIFLFFFEFALSFIVNALFFNDDTMHKIYEEKGSFDFIYNIPQIFLSSLISGFIDGLIQAFALTDSNLISFKHNTNRKNILIKKKETLKAIKIKIALFFIITLPLLIAFWFYLACFCAVYKNTQLHLIKDTVISFGTSMITPFGIYILPGIFRICALKAKKKDKECMFKFSKLLQWF